MYRGYLKVAFVTLCDLILLNVTSFSDTIYNAEVHRKTSSLTGTVPFCFPK